MEADEPTKTVGAPVRPTEEGRPQKTVACPTMEFRNYKTLHIDIFLDGTLYLGALLRMRVSEKEIPEG
jgi:hypothetical protein